ncbi:chromosome partitioning protein [Azospirillum sp. TSA2s]|uniref:AAA family ATPase n=1 Tax=Azospirillum sp. TSA2s TaxID=709810 RepID=UPI0010AA0B43|nr:AAA family ATPase [Azospirillum sp. TSA2s]QCG93264.1 chromosome partitioning protein [Azospirillum sp. TSA2s]
MKGEELRTQREAKGLSQSEFAVWLNGRLQRRYDKQKISRWENDAERIPAAVDALMTREIAGPEPERLGGPALVVVVANQKGGCAKTVSAVNIASALALKGYSTMLIDCDPQANATQHLGIDSYTMETEGKTLYYVMHGDLELDDILVTVPESGLRVAPSSIRLAETEVELGKEAGGDFIMKEKIAAAKRSFDFIVIDTPPNIGELTKNAMVAAHTAIIPCQTEKFSLLGMAFLLENVAKIRRRMNTALGVLGIVPTIFKQRERNDREVLEQILEQYGPHLRVFDPVPKASVYAQATSVGRAAVEAMPDVAGAAVYRDVASALVEERTARIKEVDRVA